MKKEKWDQTSAILRKLSYHNTIRVSEEKKYIDKQNIPNTLTNNA